MNTKKRIYVIIAVVVVLVVMLVVNLNYVFIGGEAIRKDSAVVEIDFKNKRIGRDLKRLDRFSEMDDLWLKFITDDDNTEYIPQVKSLGRLTIPFSELKSTDFLNNFENVRYLNFTGTNVDFENLSVEASIEKMDLWTCNTRNFDKVGKCPAIKEMSIFQSNLSGEGNDQVSYQLDSQILAGFDYVTALEITNMSIPDISGFLDMKSLKELTVKRYTLDEPPITEEQADELRKAGINVTVDNEKH
ncbi:MAG: hypothetical protein HDT43_13090 [Ruminococcaceae bacterium]|nr:hypothetical protein [Oscillospiraceae bacterium]